jgi:O-antigen/teichoic acid export membrane protein
MGTLTKIRKVSRNRHTLSLAGNGSAAILGFICLALAARLLTKQDLGTWFIFITAFTFVDILRSGIIHTSLIRAASSANKRQFFVIAGSGWVISLISTSIIALITSLSFLIFENQITNEGLRLFLKWYWVTGFVTLPYNYATWLMQARQAFDKVLYIRLLNQLSFMFCILLGLFTNNTSLSYLLACFIISCFLPSFISLWTGWSWIKSIRFADRTTISELFDFGKFSMGTLMGSNLLRSSDTLIIGFLMTSQDVAAYAIPLKLVEVLEIPIRSFVATAMPAMSMNKLPSQKAELRKIFNKYAGVISIALLPVIIGCILFADSLVVILGGSQYAESANILRILAIYTAFVPLDRFSGVTLDIIGKPGMNFIKVMLMLFVNITGDIIAIHYVGEIWAVALVSILTFFTGLVFGNYFLKKHLEHSIAETLNTGLNKINKLGKPVYSKLKELRLGLTNTI